MATKNDAAHEIHFRDLTLDSCGNWLSGLCKDLASAFDARPKVNQTESSEWKKEIK